MTIDPFVCRETDVHIKRQIYFFPSKIPILQKQLRHFISSPHSNLVYFANRKDIYCLDTTTRRRTHITELPFVPRCTATGHGWFCAGGHEKGYFAAIPIPEAQSSRPGTGHGQLLDHSTSPWHTSSTDGPPLSGRLPPLRPRIERLGDKIVNSISIHRLSGAEGDAPDDVIAVLTNNDLTVRMYSLTQDLELRVEDFPFAMNHASISPNGKMLVIVGDNEFVYFYEDIGPSSAEKFKNRPGDAKYSRSEWESLRIFRLYKPPGAEYSAYFSTAWSPSGKLCAVASEHGYITVFNVDSIAQAETESDAIVAIVPSTRPNTTPGAIRSMFFAPEPWDLLIWTENHGRACIGDLRSGLKSRQVIHLDPKAENVAKMEVIDSSNIIEAPDLDLELDFVRRHQRGAGQGDESAATSFATDYMTAVAERRRLQRQAGVSELSDELHGFTEQELQILDGLRTTRQREGLLQHNHRLQQDHTDQFRRPSPHSINYMTPVRRGSQPPGQSSLVTDRAQQELARQHRDSVILGSVRDYLRTEPHQLRRDRPSLQQPRRRSSVVLSPHSTSNTSHLFSSRLANSNANRPLPTTATAPLSSASATITDLDPWRTIVSAMDNTSSPTTPPHVFSFTNTLDRVTTSAITSTRDDLPPLISSSALVEPGPNRAADVALRRSLQERQHFVDAGRRDADRRRRATALTADTMDVTREATAAIADHTATRAERAAILDHTAARRDAAMRDLAEAEARRRAVIEAMDEADMGTGYSFSNDEWEDPEWGVGTTGCAWGEGGRVVFIGTEEGIFEVKMNFQERKFWPAVEPR